ncbi:MAG: hypothetical protein ACOX0J_02170 [Thermoactinomyces vulgaris]|jgi:hypothetical protein
MDVANTYSTGSFLLPWYKKKTPAVREQLIPHILHNHIRHKPHIRLWFYAASLLHNGDMFSNRGLSLENGSRQHTSSFIIYKIQSFLYIINKLGEDLNKTRPNYQSVIGIKIRITIKIKLNIIYIKLLNIFINLVIIELIKCKGA